MGEKYTTEPISGYNSAPPADDGTETEANKVKWVTHKDKLSDPIKTQVANIDTKLLAMADVGPNAQTANYTTLTTDHQKTIEVQTAGVVITLLAVTSAPVGYTVTVKNDSGGAIEVDATGSETIDGSTGTIMLADNESTAVQLNQATTGYITLQQTASDITSAAQVYKGSAAGTANALTVSLTPVLSALSDGIVMFVRAFLSNTGEATINVDSLGVKSIKKNGDDPIGAGDISKLDHELILRYNSGNDAWELLNPKVSNREGNKLINGDGIISSRTIGSPINDDTYSFDRWVVLSDGNGVVTPSQETSDLPDNARSAMKLLVAVANKKFGLLQVVEGANCKDIIGDVASLSAQAKASGISNLRVAVLSWDGTEDSVTTDVVSAWNAAGVDPTLVANWTYENTPADIALTTSWAATYEALNISIDTASTKQVAVFIWIDDTDAATSDYLLLTEAQLEKGGVKTDFERRSIGEETSLCQRYYEFNTGRNIWSGDITSGSIYRVSNTFAVEKRIIPSVVITYQTSSGFPASAPSVGTRSTGGFEANDTSNSTAAAGYYFFEWSADAEL